MAESANIARHLPLMAARQPAQAAIKIPRGRTATSGIDYLTLSFAELDREVDAWVARLYDRGIQRGDRVLVMVRQGLPLIAAAFALFKLGAVPVIIDPGMGRKSFLACVTRSHPRVLLGIPLAQAMSHVFRTAFKTVKVRVWVSGSPTARLGGGSKISNLRSEMVASEARDLAAVLFTSGSTGEPKGVFYEHGMFDAQVRLIRETYAIEPGEIDMPMLPIFALFNPALGLTTVVPEIDPRHPATVDPEKIVRAIRQEQVTTTFGSPALWRKISRYCLAHQITMPSVKRVLMAGAPVPPSLFADVQKILPNGTAHSPYGATESLPVTSISAREVLEGTAAKTAAGAGTCVGRPVREIELKVIAATNAIIELIGEARELPAGEIGEIIVRGPVVTQAYDDPLATIAAKIPPEKIAFPDFLLGGWIPVWHRLGDLGYLDAQGRLWFCGRKAEAVVTPEGPLYTEQVEPIFNAHQAVARSALVGLGPRGLQEPVLVVEPLPSAAAPDFATLARELRVLAGRHPHTAVIKKFFFLSAFPVDVRHNAKIHRLTLAAWAATARPYEPDKLP